MKSLKIIFPSLTLRGKARERCWDMYGVAVVPDTWTPVVVGGNATPLMGCAGGARGVKVITSENPVLIAVTCAGDSKAPIVLQKLCKYIRFTA